MVFNMRCHMYYKKPSNSITLLFATLIVVGSLLVLLTNFFGKKNDLLSGGQRVIALREACDALLRDLDIPRDSRAGKKLVAGDLEFDEKSNCYYLKINRDEKSSYDFWIPGESGLTINLKTYSFTLYLPVEDAKYGHRSAKGRFYFSKAGELKAEVDY